MGPSKVSYVDSMEVDAKIANFVSETEGVSEKIEELIEIADGSRHEKDDQAKRRELISEIDPIHKTYHELGNYLYKLEREQDKNAEKIIEEMDVFVSKYFPEGGIVNDILGGYNTLESFSFNEKDRKRDYGETWVDDALVQVKKHKKTFLAGLKKLRKRYEDLSKQK
jgi:hypothetical protein